MENEISDAAKKAVRLEYRVLSSLEANDIALFKQRAAILWDEIDRMGPPSRETSLAKTHLEESVMWAVKHLTN